METGTGIPADSPSKPLKVFRDRGLSVCIFQDTAMVRGQQMTFFNSRIQRSYKDGNAFKTTHTLAKDDLLRAQQLLSQAWQWIVSEEAARKKHTK